jgi:hypothetical protein
MAQEATQDWGANDAPAQEAPADFGSGDTVVAGREHTDLTAFKSTAYAPDVAHEALALSQQTGLGPTFVADQLDEVRSRVDRENFADFLRRTPTVAEWASQSPVHAAAVKDDVGPLEALHQGLADLGYSLDAAKQVDFPTREGELRLQGYEEAAAEYGKRNSGVVASFLRQIPTLGEYFLLGAAGKRFGGKAGEIGATGGLMFLQSRGEIYRRIMNELPLPTLDEEANAHLATEANGEYDPVAYEQRARIYATAGATASAALGAGLSSAITYALPGASGKVRALSSGIIARAFTDPATRPVIQRLAGMGGKTVAGALMMAVPAVVNDVTVQKSVSGEVNIADAAQAGWEAFKSGLLAAGVLTTVEHAAPLVRDLGRLHESRTEQARLDQRVEAAKRSTLVQKSPAQAESLIAQMSAGSDTPTAYIAGEAAQQHAAQVVEALADGGRSLAEAQATGGDVAVPMEKYLTQLADQHEALREDVKLSPEGVTPREASLLADQLHKEMFPPESFTKADETTPTQEQPRLQDAMAARYGGTPEQWEATLAGDMPKRIAAAVSPPAEQPAAWQGRSPEDWAAELVDTKSIAEIQPGRYALDARRAEDQLAAIATEGAEKGQQAARQGFLGAGMQDVGKEQTPNAGKENLREAGRTADVAQRRLDKLPMLERNRDLARALAARAGEVRQEMDKARAYLDSRDAPKYRAELALAGPEYLKAFDAILDAVDPTMAGSKKLSGALDDVLPKLPLVGFDEVALREVLDGSKGWNKLSPPEVRNVVDAVKNIRKAAHDANEIRLSDKAQSLRDFVASVTAEASTRKDLGAPPLTDSAAGASEKLAHGAALINAANLKPETIFSRLGDTALRFYEDKLVAARNYKAEMQGRHLKYFVENFDRQMRGLSSWLSEPVKTSFAIPVSVDLDGTGVTNETLAMAFLNLGTPGNEQRLLSGYKFDPVQIRQEIGKFLPREKLDLLQGILSYNDEHVWPLIRDHAKEQTAIAPPKVQAQKIRIPLADGTVWEGDGGYFPAAPNHRALSVPLHMQSDVPGGVEPDQAARMTVQASFTKERAAKASYPVDLNWSRYPAHLASVFHYLAYDGAVRDVGKLLRDTEFQRTMRHYVGEEYLQQLKEDQRIWARGSVGDANGVLSYIDRLFASVLRSRAVSNALAFSTPIALGQESHIQYAITSGEISLKNATAAMARQLPFTDTWTATRAILDEVRFRSDRYADQFREAISGQPARSLLGHGVDRAAFAQMEVADAMLSHVIGDAALNDALGQGMSMEDAVREANRKVRKLMPTHNVMEMAPIVRSKGTIGALSLFRGLPNVVWQVESDLYDEARQGVAGASGARQIAGAGVRVATNTARAVASIAVLHMLGRLLMGHGKKDEDGEGLAGWGTWAEREALASQFSRIPLGRDVAEPIIDAVQHDKPIAKAIGDIRVAPDLAVVQGIVKDLGKIVSDSTASEDKVQAGVNTALTALGVGARQITKTGRFAYDARRGNVDVRGPGDVVGGVIYGKRPRQEKNIPVAMQDIVSGE